jgi:hypothetical protein
VRCCAALSPAIEEQALDHDDGIAGFSVDRTFMVRTRKQVLGGAPAIAMAQIRKDKNTFALVVRLLSSL